MNRRDIPNLISGLRILLVFPIVWALLTQQFTLALWLFAIAGVSDALDGFLAKHYGWESVLGSFLDPVADKFLLVLSYIALAWIQVLPLWLVATVLIRDVVIVSGAIAYRFRVGPFEGKPTLLSKFNTLMQILLVLAVVAAQQVFTELQMWMSWMVLVVMFTTISSGLDYVVRWTLLTVAANKKGRT